MGAAAAGAMGGALGPGAVGGTEAGRAHAFGGMSWPAHGTNTRQAPGQKKTASSRASRCPSDVRVSAGGRSGPGGAGEPVPVLAAQAVVKPMMVQNRCYAALGWDKEVREICRAHGIIYQGFSLLTANREVLADPEIQIIARRLGAGPAQIIFRFAMQIGMVPWRMRTLLGFSRR